MMPISEVFNEDCMQGMSRYPDKYFDLAITDPPFFAGVGTDGFYGASVSTTGIKRKVYSVKTWDNEIPNINYYNELCRVSKHQIIWGINYFTDFRNVPVGRIVWDKKNDTATFSNCEIASCSLITSVKIFRYTWNGFIQEQGKEKETKIHPTQKPVQLYKWTLSNYAKKGDKILDTHTGSQSSRIASFKLGFDYWGFEKDRETFYKGNKRFSEQTAQIQIF